MKRLLITFILLIVVVASATVGYLIFRTTRARAFQDQSIHDVEYSTLEANPKQYVGKIVRVKALVFGGPLDDPRLVNEKVPNSGVSIGYDFAPDAKDASAKLQVAFGPEVWIPHKVERCERALATLVGQFIEDPTRTKYNPRAGNQLGYHYWIIVTDLQDITPCPKLWFHDVYK
jgi:hypothetical protein